MSQHILLGMVQGLDGDDDHMSPALEPSQVFGRIVGRLINTPRIEEGEQRRFRSRKLILPGVVSASMETLADFSLIGAGQVFDNRGLAALRLSKQPKHR
jgi:hypothetical protein